MVNKNSGIELLKKNLDKVETKFIHYFENEPPRWPSEKRDYLRNHHQSLDQFSPATISWEKLRVNFLPEDILHEVRAAYDAFELGEAYEAP
jgi:hypothetical protein